MSGLPLCCLDARVAYWRGELVWSDSLEGWMLRSAPLRRSSWRQEWFAGEGVGMKHDGEPFGWTCCPWCGGDLPVAPPTGNG